MQNHQLDNVPKGIETCKVVGDGHIENYLLVEAFTGS